jgi:hypothetical protein
MLSFRNEKKGKNTLHEQFSNQGVATSLLKALLTSFSASVSQSKQAKQFPWMLNDIAKSGRAR